LGVCDFCGFLYNLQNLRWQFEWIGPRLQNQRMLVCRTCNDKPQEQLRTIVLPPDPIPVFNARPENYVQDDNPLSAVGVSANFLQPTYGSRIGNLTGAAGLNAPFDGMVNKQAWQSATNVGVSNSSYNNYVGINWQGNIQGTPASIAPPALQHTLLSVSVYAPYDRGIISGVATTFAVQASATDTPLYAAWTTITTQATTGAAGESYSITITSTMTNPVSQFHRVAVLGSSLGYVALAQVQFNVAQTGEA
jgi:hypothetical protein